MCSGLVAVSSSPITGSMKSATPARSTCGWRSVTISWSLATNISTPSAAALRARTSGAMSLSSLGPECTWVSMATHPVVSTTRSSCSARVAAPDSGNSIVPPWTANSNPRVAVQAYSPGGMSRVAPPGGA